MTNSVIDNSEVTRLAGAVNGFHNHLDDGLDEMMKAHLTEIFLNSIMNERAIALAGPGRAVIVPMED